MLVGGSVVLDGKCVAQQWGSGGGCSVGQKWGGADGPVGSKEGGEVALLAEKEWEGESVTKEIK